MSVPEPMKRWRTPWSTAAAASSKPVTPTARVRAARCRVSRSATHAGSPAASVPVAGDDADPAAVVAVVVAAPSAPVTDVEPGASPDPGPVPEQPARSSGAATAAAASTARGDGAGEGDRDTARAARGVRGSRAVRAVRGARGVRGAAGWAWCGLRRGTGAFRSVVSWARRGRRPSADRRT
ncbi:hypothetical protein [Corynebacterium bovis]|uniref:hypothetical protein n=2 Tax=Corynebacterium bovis TaxID=36808 RepID=UPI0021AB1A4A|nr:hypothetical protein [Corynebacterium bovis]